MKKYIILLLLLSCSIGNAQYNLFARQNFAKIATAITYNTYIGGVSGTITSASSLATKLGISVGNISNFTIVGSDIKCKITGSYTIPTSAFNFSSPCTYYTDSDNLVNAINGGAFYSMSTVDTNIRNYSFKNAISVNFLAGYSGAFQRSNAESIILDNCVNIGEYSFSQNPYLKTVYIPFCTNLGGTSLDNNVFFEIPSTAILYVNPSLATNNGGLPDGDLTASGAIIRYVTNFTAPNPITDLAAGNIYNTAIQLNFTAPTGSTNAIEFYELYVNGIYTKRLISGDYATGLTENTSYNLTVCARDIFYNKSLVSNTVTQSTSNYAYTDTDANASISAKSLTGKEKESEYLLITGLKSNSLYAKTQAIYTFKGTTSTQHKFNSKNPIDTNAAFRLTFTGAATFSNLGYQLNGSSYANTNFIPSANQNVNSNGMTIVCGTNNSAAGADVVDMGSFNLATQKSYIIVKNNNTTYARIAGFNSANISLTGTNESRGIFTGTKQSSTVTDFFINGTQAGTVNSGGTLPTYDTYIGAMNYVGAAYGYSNQRFQIVIFHEGFNDSETTALHSVIDLSETIAGRKTW